MNIAIIGYGKMGKEIEKICLKRKHTVLLKINSKNSHLLKSDELKKCDVAIEFSDAQNALKNILFLIKKGIPIVSGTTGWDNEITIAHKKCMELKKSFLHSPNFSIGMNIFFELNNFLAKKMNIQDQYKASISESHHKNKKDKPSGTAIKLANDINKEINKIKEWGLDSNQNNTLPINCIREGDIKGLHKVTYKSFLDTISIQHEAKSRECFATGAVIAAEFIQNKKGIFTMKDVINDKL